MKTENGIVRGIPVIFIGDERVIDANEYLPMLKLRLMVYGKCFSPDEEFRSVQVRNLSLQYQYVVENIDELNANQKASIQIEPQCVNQYHDDILVGWHECEEEVENFGLVSDEVDAFITSLI
jgi:hypothetical protein